MRMTNATPQVSAFELTRKLILRSSFGLMSYTPELGLDTSLLASKSHEKKKGKLHQQLPFH